MKSIDPFTGPTRGWVAHRLPQLNSDIERGIDTIETLVTEVSLIVVAATDIVERIGYQLSVNDARSILQLVGFGISSVESHMQSIGNEPGTGIQRIPGADALLARLGVLGKHPPRDSHYTYWKLNQPPDPLTFTGDRQEVLFNERVNLTIQLHADSCTILRLIVLGIYRLEDAATENGLAIVADNHRRLKQAFGGFMEKIQLDDLGGRLLVAERRSHPDPDVCFEDRGMEPAFFMTRMRVYLPTYPVAGVTWEGVNAANIPEQMALDYLLGTVLDWYGDVCRDRSRFLTCEDKEDLQSAMDGPSLLGLVLSASSITAEECETMPVDALARRINLVSPALKRTLVAFADVVEAAGDLSALHWSLINHYLIAAAKRLPDERRRSLAVAPDEGTGRMAMKGVQDIFHMRKRHPHAAKLVAAVRSTNPRHPQDGLRHLVAVEAAR